MVSIIIPTYNYAAYLPETLDSVLAQTYDDWECIVVDDGSFDHTKELVESYCAKDPRFRYVDQLNQGVSSARNTGLALAEGEFIQFLDGDDLLQQDKIKIHVSTLVSHPEFDMVYGEFRFFSDKDSEKLRYSLRGQNEEDCLPKLSARGKDWVKLLSKKNVFVINAPLLRKSVFDRIGNFDENMKGLEDWDFWMRAALADLFIHFCPGEKTFALVRQHDGSLSTQQKNMVKGNLIFLQKNISHPASHIQFKFILLLKYVEVFWNAFFKTGRCFMLSISLTLFSFLLLPVYLLIKMVRLIK